MKNKKQEEKADLNINDLDIPEMDKMWGKIILASITSNQYKDSPKDRLSRTVIICLTILLTVLSMCFTYYISSQKVIINNFPDKQEQSVQGIGNDNTINQTGGKADVDND